MLCISDKILNMLTEILHSVTLFKSQIADLKSKSPTYPNIYFEEKGGCLWVSTIVEFKHKDVRYKRHHVESIHPTKTCTINHLYNRLIDAAEMCIKFGLPCKFDEII